MTDIHASSSHAARRTRWLLYGGLAIVILIVAFGLWLASRPVPDQLQGMVDADEVNVATKALARVDHLIANEGDRVKPGELLATLSSPEIAGGEQQAQGALDSARALQHVAETGARREDVASLKETWLAAQAAADLAAVSSRRADALYAQGVIAAQRRDEASAGRDSSARTADATRQQYLKALRGTRPEDKQVAAAQVEIAQAGLATARSLGTETRLVSPIDGEISRKLVQPGEIVSPVVPAYQVVDIDHPWVSLNVREDSYKGFAIGRILSGSIPALGTSARFKVSYINPRGDFATWRATRQSAGYDVRAFEIRLRPISPVAGLRPGMSVLFDWPQ
ncbi:HlyD family secretion protein [Sphingomonas abietis]|uniref:Efflux RND transporter periplasmic adaptor subunit n=1 Tax=Sphingomonas abietis TaxID=3012344 RepID=A0ABY7NRY7_9SPHN|nr:efflux RND transporter periplasmic adaptor subunit [Sphingomonas abietis]WBO24265.1 efflux RND transporter periplasmic adaptor subunit [Sphingomonas abietis]